MKPRRNHRVHPWELAWKRGSWKESSGPDKAVVGFVKHLKEMGATRVLDLGAGAGRHTIFLAGEGFQVTALDVSETALKTLEVRFRDRRLGATLVLHEMGELPFIDDYFDAVVSTNVIHHGLARKIRQTLREVHRVLREDGEALITVLSEGDFRMGTGKKLEHHTYVFTLGDEKSITHHFFSGQELASFLEDFEIESLKEEKLPVKDGYRAHFYARIAKR